MATSSGAGAVASDVPGIIVDCDAGIDDAQALFAVLRAQEKGLVRLLAIICTAGNCGIESVIGNVCAVLEAFGGPAAGAVRVFVGASRPLVAKPAASAEEWMGADGLGGCGYGAAASRKCVDVSCTGAVALLQILRVEEEGGRSPPVLLLLGPCSTLALALRLGVAGEVEKRVGRLVVMGGAVEARGNSTATAEFNIMADPEAAAIVFRTQWATAVLIPWELTTRSGLPPITVAHWLNANTPRSKWLGAVSAFLIAASSTVEPAAFARKGFFIPDPLAAVAALRPDAIVKSKLVGICVELQGTYTRAMTVVDWGGRFVCDAPRCWNVVHEMNALVIAQTLIDSIAER